MAYRIEKRSDRWKAMAAAIAVTGLLGAGVLTGLNVDVVRHAVERMQTFDVSLPRIPPEQPPPRPEPKPARPRQPAPAAPRASPNPRPEVQVPTPRSAPASAQPGSGASAASGQGGAGNGTGSGGSGGGNVPARLVRNLSRSDYRRLTGGRMESGSAGLAIGVDSSGRVDSCKVEHSSGDGVIDAGLCPLVRARLRFEPARDSSGRPIPFYTHYLATWRR